MPTTRGKTDRFEKAVTSVLRILFDYNESVHVHFDKILPRVIVLLPPTIYL